MSSNDHQASFYRLAHFAAELARRNSALDWDNSKALQLRSSACKMLRDTRAVNYELLTDWKTEDILSELIRHVNSMVLSVSATRKNPDIGIELANFLYRLKSK